MSKKLIAISVAVLILGLFSTVAMAGVEGSFTLDIHAFPKDGQTPTTEVMPLSFDLEALLNLDVTLSGLTLSNDLALGIAGIEHYIFGLETTLGALNLKDEFVFATPYINCIPHTGPGGIYTSTGAWYACDKVGSLLFVKKRVTAELTLAGLSLENLLLLEDFNFPIPEATTPASYTAADQNFAFGNILTISGETVSGISITAKTGISADWTHYLDSWSACDTWIGIYEDYTTNYIKKASWSEAVTSTDLTFWKEEIAIENVAVGPVTLNSYTYWEQPFTNAVTSYLNAEASLLGFDLDYWAKFNNILSLSSAANILSLSSDPFSVTWLDDPADLDITGDSVLINASLAIQALELSSDVVYDVGTGMDDFCVTGTLTLGDSTFAVTFDYDKNTTLDLDEITFDLDAALTADQTLMFDLTYDVDWGLEEANLKYKIDFAV